MRRPLAQTNCKYDLKSPLLRSTLYPHNITMESEIDMQFFVLRVLYHTVPPAQNFKLFLFMNTTTGTTLSSYCSVRTTTTLEPFKLLSALFLFTTC
jgi:hypothetical protein